MASQQHPVADWWKRRRRRRQHHSTTAAVVGTEAKALENLEKNQKAFDYPPQGFVTRIEYSLLYSMISSPKVFPKEVVLQHVGEEHFEPYLEVAQGSSSSNKETSGVSYAQLSAILALSAEKFPPQDYENDDDNDDDDNEENTTTTPSASIPQTLAKAVLRCVIRHAEQHDLDRQVEVQELLQPVQRHAVKRNNNAVLTQVLPFYVGYAASLVTANPIPMLVGAGMMASSISKEGDMEQERKNVINIATQSNRMADVETTGLLDEPTDE